MAFFIVSVGLTIKIACCYFCLLVCCSGSICRDYNNYLNFNLVCSSGRDHNNYLNFKLLFN